MKKLVLTAVLLVLLVACGSPEQVEVTRIVETEVEVSTEVTRIVEVESIIEATRIVEVEVTRIVEVEVPVEVTRVVESVVEVTAVPTEAAVGEGELFAFNYIGEASNSDITVELGRFLCGTKEELLENGLDFDEWDDAFIEYASICEFLWRITNETGENIQWSFDDINFRINNTQIKYDDWVFVFPALIDFQPTDEIFTGSTVTGGIWIGTHINPDEITTASLLFSPARDTDFREISEAFVVDAEIPAIREFQPVPDELR